MEDGSGGRCVLCDRLRGDRAAGWLITRAWRRPLPLVPTGIGIWLSTVAAGMVLRVVSGQGIAFTFVIVALVFLGLTLLGWRAAARLARSRRTA